MVEDFQLHTRGAVDAMDAGTQTVNLGVEIPTAPEKR